MRAAAIACMGLLASGGLAADRAPKPDPLDVLRPFVGTWSGRATLHGAPARLELRFERVLGDRFVRLQHRSTLETPAGPQVFEGLALYRPAAGGFVATWFDSFGHVYPVTAFLDGATLRAEWGAPGTEQGVTLYRLAAGALEVTDSVRKAGVLKEFGRATLSAQ
jgi:hypothetical protein